MKSIRGLVIIGMVWLLPTAALADPYPDNSCELSNGDIVQSINDKTLKNYARAAVEDGQPVIYYNSAYLDKMPLVVRTFWFYHECGHVVLGHLLKHSPTLEGETKLQRRVRYETDADCWSAKRLTLDYKMTKAHWLLLKADMKILPGNEIYPKGPKRWQTLVTCLVRDPDIQEICRSKLEGAERWYCELKPENTRK